MLSPLGRSLDELATKPGPLLVSLGLLVGRFSLSDYAGFFAFSFLGHLSPITTPCHPTVAQSRFPIRDCKAAYERRRMARLRCVCLYDDS
jgi:hypothetical protein